MRTARAIPLIACAWLAATGARAEPGERELTVLNHATRAIDELYVSPSQAGEWGPDRVDDAPLAPGGSLRVRLGRTPECLFDVQVVYAGDAREERHAIDVCHTRAVTFDGTGIPSPPHAVRHAVAIANETARPVQMLYISPAEAGDWGDDRLGGGLSVGEVAHLVYEGPCVVDLRVVFDNRAAEERRGVDICVRGGLALTTGWTTADALEPPPSPPSPAAATPVAVTVLNHSGLEARNLFIFPEHAGAHGDDLLGGPLVDGGQATVVVARPPETCRFTAIVGFGPQHPDRRIGAVDLCRTLTLTLNPP